MKKREGRWLLVVLFALSAVLNAAVSDVHPQNKVASHLDSFTGKYEFYLADNYHKLTLFVESGQLKIRESPDSILQLTPVESEDKDISAFSGVQRGKPFRIEFFKNPDNIIVGFRFISGSLVIPVTREPESCLKEKYAVSELREDFQQFRKLVESKAVSRLTYISKERFDRLYDEVGQSIQSSMTLREFYTLLLPLKEKLGCGHTHLDYPQEYRSKVQVQKFPLKMILHKNKCRLLEDLSGKEIIARFNEITAINGIAMAKLIETIKGDISADGYNSQFKKAAFSLCFQYYYANRYGVPEAYTIGFREAFSDKQRRVVIPAIPCKGIHYSNQKPGKLNFSILPGTQSAVITIPSFSYYGARNRIFFDFVDRAFQRIGAEKIDNVILDLRGNGGGDPWCGSYLLSYLEKVPVKYFAGPYPRYEKLADPVPFALKNRFTGNLYVLIDRSNFSTSGHFLSLLKYHQRATFVGEETGSTYTCNGAVKGFTLKNTRLYVKLSTRSYAAAVKGFKKERGILPDIPVISKISDMIAGRDVLLEKTLALIRERTVPPKNE